MLTYKALEKSLTTTLAGMTAEDLVSTREANTRYAEHRSMAGFAFCVGAGTFLTDETGNEKLGKGEGVRLVMLALAPHEASAVANLCPHSTESCRRACVAFAGNGGFPKVLSARQARTAFLAEHPREFVSLLVHTLDKLVSKGDVAVRLNGFSDLRWERILPAWFWNRFAGVKFYDYTKHTIVSRPVDTMPSNYSLTYSVTERSTPAIVTREREAGRSVAVVVNRRGGKHATRPYLHPLPFPDHMVDGDINDRRFDDPPGSVVALRRKGSLMPSDALVVHDDRLALLIGV